MLYDSSTSDKRKSRELELLRSILSGINGNYSWEQIKDMLQKRIFPQCEKFGTWYSSEESRPSPESESTTKEHLVLGPPEREVCE